MRNASDDLQSEPQSTIGGHPIRPLDAANNAGEETGPRRAEDESRNAVERAVRQWRATFDAMQEAVALLDPDLKIVRCNTALHAMDRDLPVIIITGHPDSVLLTQALRYPPVMMLPKPVDRAVLLGAVRRVLYGARRKDGEKQ
jgi:PAS domain-containing protein